MIHRSVMLEDQKLPSSRVACLQVEQLLYRIYTVTYKLRFTELVSDVKGKIKPRLSKHSWITSKENLTLRRLRWNASQVFLTLHIPENKPPFCLSPAIHPSHLFLFLSVALLCFVSCCVKVGLFCGNNKCPDFLLPGALGCVESTDVDSWWQSLLAGCASAFVWGLAFFCDASWRGILGICFHLDQTVEPIEECSPASLLFYKSLEPNFVCAIWEQFFVVVLVWSGREWKRIAQSEALCSPSLIYFIGKFP